MLRHRDAFKRIATIEADDADCEYYLQPCDGRLTLLHVQGAGSFCGYTGPGHCRTGQPVRQISFILNLVHWTYSSILKEGTEDRDYSSGAMSRPAIKWIPSCLLLVPMLLIPQNLEDETGNGGFYDPVARNVKEGPDAAEFDSYDLEECKPLMQDVIEMKALTQQVPTLRHEAELDDDYTRKQSVVATEQEFCSWTVSSPTDYIQLAKDDRENLKRYGIEAAHTAGADNQAKAETESKDVYNICDIVRIAHTLVLLVGPPVESKLPGGVPQAYSTTTAQQWLQVWGSRLWTLPEILLCSAEHRIRLYAIGNVQLVWSDAKAIRQLIDHHDFSVHLTQLELVSIALECLARRTIPQFAKADFIYALMGLLRRRPPINKAGTSFEALAKLSLANDSDMLLEHLICMQPLEFDAAWHQIVDAWGARLWDIEPRCQVAGIDENQTVMLDGAFGASIQWVRADPVAFFKRPTLSRTFEKILLRVSPVYFLIGLALTVLGVVLKPPSDGHDSKKAPKVNLASFIPGLILLVPAAVIVFSAPAMLLDMYGGKLWNTQALFVGFEGEIDIGVTEQLLFGFNNGASQARVGLPSRESKANQNASPAEPSRNEPGSLFTIVNTYCMTATAISVRRPPTVVLVCGQEGGMHRAVLCSYDWRRDSFARETVIRVKTKDLDRMSRVDQFRFALRRIQDDGKSGTTTARARALPRALTTLDQEASGRPDESN
ncbi:hypothetical protein F4780DRAFT_773650 [Xylariomycetidae sp. FL0641]|nr:hypothetical protein F4780DRAFT_773650 [Xylariomycetidae sp. FL0641]